MEINPKHLFEMNITDDLEINAYVAGIDETGRQLFGIPDPQDVQAVYERRELKFWRDVRSRENAPPQLRSRILQQQQEDYSTGSKVGMAAYLEQLGVEAIQQDRQLSILELGCANGITIRHFRKFCPELNLNFFGIELTDFLVDNLLTRYPDARAIAGGAEEFLSMDAADFGAESFDVFLVSGVLCQIPSELAAHVLTHAAKFCDKVVLWDYLLNFDGKVSANDEVIFKLEKESQHILFLNQYENMLKNAGYSDIDINYTDAGNSVGGPLEGAVIASKMSLA